MRVFSDEERAHALFIAGDSMRYEDVDGWVPMALLEYIQELESRLEGE